MIERLLCSLSYQTDRSVAYWNTQCKGYQLGANKPCRADCKRCACSLQSRPFVFAYLGSNGYAAGK